MSLPQPLRKDIQDQEGILRTNRC